MMHGPKNLKLLSYCLNFAVRYLVVSVLLYNLDKCLALFSLEITVYTTRFFIRRILLPIVHSICVFCMELRTNSNFSPKWLHNIVF